MVLERGEGVWLYDTDGGRYLDFCAGVAVCCLGHAHPELAAALADQARQLLHVSNYFYSSQNVALAEALCQRTGYERAFFCNSGAEANEAMLKLARRYHHERGEPRTRIIAFDRAFHGRTMGALAMTGNPAYRVGFGEPLADVEHVPYGDLDAIRALFDEADAVSERAPERQIAAVIAEPVQGEGGVLVPPAGFLLGVRELCDRHGALLLVDEVQVGVGRTGTFLGSDHTRDADGKPLRGDAIALAKGLGGGVPIGVMLLSEKLAGALPPGSHGTTFGGNPLASRAALTVLHVLERDGLFEQVSAKGARLGAGLSALAEKHAVLCTGARGLGLLQGIMLNDRVTARELIVTARDHGLLVTAAGPAVLRFTPPLTVTDAEIDEALERCDAALASASS